MLRRPSAILFGLASSPDVCANFGHARCMFSSIARTSYSDNTSFSGSGEVYLPWNARPWELTYLHHAADIDYLDDNIRSILCCEDSKAMLKLVQSLGETKDIEEYLEDPIMKVSQDADEQQLRRDLEETASKIAVNSSRKGSLTSGKKNAKISQKRKVPATYIQLV